MIFPFTEQEFHPTPVGWRNGVPFQQKMAKPAAKQDEAFAEAHKLMTKIKIKSEVGGYEK